MEPKETVTLNENQVNTVQELLNAIGSLPSTWDRIESYLFGRGFDDPKAEVETLREAVF